MSGRRTLFQSYYSFFEFLKNPAQFSYRARIPSGTRAFSLLDFCREMPELILMEEHLTWTRFLHGRFTLLLNPFLPNNKRFSRNQT